MSFFWDTRIWLPEGITWDYIEAVNVKGNGIPPTLTNACDCIYIVVLLTVIKILVKHKILIPIGSYYDLRSTPVKQAPKNPALEEIFRKHKRLSEKEITALSKSLDLSCRYIDNWFRKRRNQEKSPVLVKFVESGWKFLYYTILFSYGVYALYDKDYFWDVRYTMIGYPNYVMTPEIHWYYMLELGFYLASLCWIFYEVKRSDFKVMLGHHVATVSLMMLSYLSNHHRVGAVVLVVHDIADCWMECAKMCKYIKKNTAALIVFVIFVFVWLVSRLIYFPFWVIHSTIFHGLLGNGVYPVSLSMVIFLMILQVLHIYWFCLILKIVIQVGYQGSDATDCRSESDQSDVPDDASITTECPTYQPSHLQQSLETPSDTSNSISVEKSNQNSIGSSMEHLIPPDRTNQTGDHELSNWIIYRPTHQSTITNTDTTTGKNNNSNNDNDNDKL